MSTHTSGTPAGPTTEDPTARAMTAGALPRRLGWWYVAEHTWRAMRAYAWTIVMEGIGQPLVYLLGIGLGLAAFIDVSVADGANGPVTYLEFVAPALLASSAIGITMGEFTYVVMSGFKWRRLYWGMNASPVQPQQIVGGIVFAVVVRMLLTTIAYYVLIVAFGAVVDPWTGALMPLVGTLGGLAFGLPLLAYAASITEDKGQFAMVQRFVFTPLFLFSGTFYPLDTMPVWLQWIGWLSPLWHATEIGRSLSYGSPPGAWPVGVHLAILLVMAVTGWVLARRMFVKRLRG
ncbi:ABC transporter permease [Cellulomonas sp.]|uniref:ABC transporter permease n=1 Tax=Cellulomonas sp. TaxID=40001 RepID=UPI0025B80D13|nr:ABC transporter permease [Cellulomonas sp.]